MNTIYYHSAAYAKEHGELDQYRKSNDAIRLTVKALETIISTHFDGMHLAHEAITEALAIHGPEMVGLILSATVIDKSWDGRFSLSNKEWASTVRQLDRADTWHSPAIMGTHPTILNGFIDMFRKATA